MAEFSDSPEWEEIGLWSQYPGDQAIKQRIWEKLGNTPIVRIETLKQGNVMLSNRYKKAFKLEKYGTKDNT